MTNENGDGRSLQKKKQKRNTGILRFAQNDNGFISGISVLPDGVEAEADIVCNPIAVGVAERGFEECYGLGEDGGAIGGG